MSDASPNASDPVSVRRLAKAARQDDVNRAEILRGLMSLPPGRAWVFSLLESCHIFRTTYTGDSLSAAFKEGERNVGLRLLSDVMAACPEQFILAMREANERNATANGTRRNGNAGGSESDWHNPDNLADGTRIAQYGWEADDAADPDA